MDIVYTMHYSGPFLSILSFLSPSCCVTLAPHVRGAPRRGAVVGLGALSRPKESHHRASRLRDEQSRSPGR